MCAAAGSEIVKAISENTEFKRPGDWPGELHSGLPFLGDVAASMRADTEETHTIIILAARVVKFFLIFSVGVQTPGPDLSPSV